MRLRTQLVIRPGGLISVEVDSANSALTEAEARKLAHLLEAAPALLEAIETSAIVLHIQCGARGSRALFADCVDLVCVANRAAIAKARGGK